MEIYCIYILEYSSSIEFFQGHRTCGKGELVGSVLKSSKINTRQGVLVLVLHSSRHHFPFFPLEIFRSFSVKRESVRRNTTRPRERDRSASRGNAERDHYNQGIRDIIIMKKKKLNAACLCFIQ